MTLRPSMLPLHTMLYIQYRMVLCTRDDDDSTPAVGTSTYKLVVLIFEEVMLHKQEECVCVHGQDVNGTSKEVFEVELLRVGEGPGGMMASADPNALQRGVQCDGEDCGFPLRYFFPCFDGGAVGSSSQVVKRSSEGSGLTRSPW